MPKYKNGLPPPGNKDPLIMQLTALVNDSELSSTQICLAAGVGTSSISTWASRSSPSIQNFNSVLEVLGYELVIQRRNDL